MDKPTPLVLAERGPNKSVIRALRKWLVMAKDGNISGLILLGVSPTGGFTRSSAGDLRDADAVHLAALTHADAIESSRRREKSFDPDELTDDDE